jgi:hypothetical protein
MKRQVSLQEAITTKKVSGWILVLWLSAAPVLVAITTIVVTDIPKIDPLLGTLAPPINPWLDDLPASFILAVLLGAVGWLTIFITATTKFKTLPALVRVTTEGLLALLTLVVLWLGIITVHLSIVLKYWDAPMIGFPTPAIWVFVLGGIWSVVMILFTILHSFKSSALGIGINKKLSTECE